MHLFNRSKKSSNSVNAIKNKESNGIYSKAEFKKSIGKERARADRSNHKLSLVIFDMNSSDLKKTNITHLMAEIKGRIRGVDRAGWYDD